MEIPIEHFLSIFSSFRYFTFLLWAADIDELGNYAIWFLVSSDVNSWHLTALIYWMFNINGIALSGDRIQHFEVIQCQF